MKKKVLFVCQGNICRSPSAEAVFNAKIKEKNLWDKYECDSAGTIAYHNGEPADARMQQHANHRGYRLTSISRKVQPNDWDYFDVVLAMDDENLMDLKRMCNNSDAVFELIKMTDFCTKFDYESVPDPYYGGVTGFELVLDLLEDACDGLIEHLENE